MKFHTQGITILETLITLALVSVVAAFVLPQFSSIRQNQVLRSTTEDVLSVLVLYINYDFTSVNESYDVTVDDQLSQKIESSQQEHMHRSYNIYSRFPTLDRESYTPHNKLSWEAQKDIFGNLVKNINWTDRTVSYMRGNIAGKHIINCIIRPLYNKGLFDVIRQNVSGNAKEKMMYRSPIKVVDATANIGGDSITFGLEKIVSSVTAYEIDTTTYKMLQNNINLYGLSKRIVPLNKRFDYKIPKGSFVIIDPPYESVYNVDNFNLSIDKMPIYAVAEKCLQAGAKCVMLSMPRSYKYNMKYALDHNQHVTVYQIGKVNNKMFLIMRKEDGEKLRLNNFTYHKVIPDPAAKTMKGRPNFYKCKVV